MLAALDARDRHTAGHSAVVAIYERDIACELGLSEADQQLAHVCGLVHDIGMIGLPSDLLGKPGPLTSEERGRVQEHPVIGERILASVEDCAEVATIVRHHHERIDGAGYPDGIAADEIPLVSRIVSVAEAYNAMTSDRPYRDAMPSRVARILLAQGTEGHFEVTVVAAFEAILAGATEDYRTATRRDFVLPLAPVFRLPAVPMVTPATGNPNSGTYGKPQDTSGTHAKSNSPGNSTARGSPTKHPGPDACLVSNSKAYGRYCQNQSKRHVAGQTGTSFGRCLTAMAKLATGVTKFAWTACKPLSKKPIPGQTGSAFSRCVVAGTRLLEALQKS